MAPNDFSGQVALVTGGGSGIGRATCLQLAGDGARVVIADLNLQAACDTLRLISDPENHMALQMDVTKQSSVEGVIAAARDRFKEPPTLLVNSAGILLVAPTVDVTDTTVIDVNLKGTFLVTQAFVKELLEWDRAAKEGKGAIVNVSSIVSKEGSEHGSLYAASKGGVTAFTKSCAAEMAKMGVRVNCVLPSTIDTPILAIFRREQIQGHASTRPLQRLGRPEEVAEVIVFLLSRRSSYMVGACVEITGGGNL